MRLTLVFLGLLLYVPQSQAVIQNSSTPFNHQYTDVLIDVAGLSAGALFQTVLLNPDHPFISSDVKTYRDESIPCWVIPLVHLGYAATPFAVDKNDALRNFRGFMTAFSVNFGIYSAVSSTVGRKRPNYDDAIAHGYEGQRRSFYSGHTSMSFCSATYMSLYWLDHVKQPALKYSLPIAFYGWAGYVGYTRYNEHWHHLSDIVTGACVSTAITYLVYRLYKTPSTDSAIAPAPGGIRASWSF